MPGIPLTSGAYQSESVIANAQRCVNLYPELNPKGTRPPMPVTHYMRPGKKRVGGPAVPGAGRGLYQATNGDLYAVVGDTVYYVNQLFNFMPLGNIEARGTPVSMADNGRFAGGSIVLVDGTTKGYVIDMATHAMSQLVDPTGLFVGADVVAYLQTFFMFNWPDTQNWYVSLPDSTSFDALDVAAKAGYADSIASIAVRQREVWLIGTLTTEPWYLSGAADFAFEAVPSTFVPHGCAAQYSVVTCDVSIFWLTRNLQGRAFVVKSEGYTAKRVSTHAIEQEFQKYIGLSQAIGSTYQINGHTFYVLTFPQDNVTWIYDLATDQWFQSAWTDQDGVLNRDRATFYASAYGTIVGQDWETGDLYEISSDYVADGDDVITCIRGFPHVLADMKRITHNDLTVDIDCGTGLDPNVEYTLSMRYSDDRGHSFYDWVTTSLGKTGEYWMSPQFRRLGQARDRVYELMWAEKMKTALNGVYINDPEEAES